MLELPLSDGEAPRGPPEKLLVLGIIHLAISDVERHGKDESRRAMEWIFESEGEQSLAWWCQLIGEEQLIERTKLRANELSKSRGPRKTLRQSYRRNL